MLKPTACSRVCRLLWWMLDDVSTRGSRFPSCGPPPLGTHCFQTRQHHAHQPAQSFLKNIQPLGTFFFFVLFFCSGWTMDPTNRHCPPWFHAVLQRYVHILRLPFILPSFKHHPPFFLSFLPFMLTFFFPPLILPSFLPSIHPSSLPVSFLPFIHQLYISKTPFLLFCLPLFFTALQLFLPLCILHHLLPSLLLSFLPAIFPSFPPSFFLSLRV